MVSYLEDGRLRVLVDGDDHLRVLHTSQVLNSARNSHGNVQVLVGRVLVRVLFLLHIYIFISNYSRCY